MAFGSIADILFQWENIGFFDIVLPFLLIFSIVYGILSYMKIFGDNRAVHAIIAVVLGLLSIRLGFFQAFLLEIAPRLGVGLTVLLVVLILVGLFVQDQSKKAMGWILIGLATIIFIVILSQMYAIFGEFGGGLGLDNPETLGWIIMIGLLIVIIVVVAIGNSKDSHSSREGKFVPMFESK